MNVSTYITRRFFRFKKSSPQTIMSKISILGITLGVATLIASYSIAKGFEDEYHRTILDFNAHVVVLNQDEIQNYESLMAKLDTNENSADGMIGIMPFIYREGLVVHKDKIKGIVIKGILPDLFKTMSDVKINFFDEKYNWFANKASFKTVILGKAFAEALGIGNKVDEIKLLSPRAKMDDIANSDKYERLKVVGIFESGLYDFDSQFIMMTLKDAMRFFQTNGKVTGLEIKLDHPDKAQGFAKKLYQQLSEPSFQIRDWADLNAGLFKAVKLEKIVFTLIMGIMVVVGAFNIIGALVIQIIDKKRQIAVLKSIGLEDRPLILIFLTQGLILGLIGTFLGLILGFLAIWGIHTFHLIPIDPSIYFLDELPVSISPIAYVFLALMAVVICFVTAFIAAKKVVDLNIVQGLGQTY